MTVAHIRDILKVLLSINSLKLLIEYLSLAWWCPFQHFSKEESSCVVVLCELLLVLYHIKCILVMCSEVNPLF